MNRKLIALSAVALIVVALSGLYLYGMNTASAEILGAEVEDLVVKDGAIYIIISASIRNPSNIGAQVESIAIDVYYMDDKLGSLHLREPIWVGAGETVNATLELEIQNVDVFSSLLGEVLSGRNVSIGYGGTASVKAGMFPASISVEGEMPFSLEKMFSISRIAEEDGEGVLEIEVRNSFSADIMLVGVEGSLYYGDSAIGTVTGLAKTVVISGGSRGVASIKFTPMLLKSLVEDVLKSGFLEARFDGSIVMDIEGVTLNVPVVIDETLSLDVAATFSVSNIELGTGMKISGLLNLPLGFFTASLKIVDLTATLKCEEVFLGTARLQNISVVPGEPSLIGVTYIPTPEGLSRLLSVLISPSKAMTIDVTRLEGTIGIYGNMFEIDSATNISVNVNVGGIDVALDVTVKEVQRRGEALKVLVNAMLRVHGVRGSILNVHTANIIISVDGVETTVYARDVQLALGRSTDIWVTVDFKPFSTPLSSLIEKAIREGLDVRVNRISAELGIGYTTFQTDIEPNWTYRLSPFRIEVEYATIEEVGFLDVPPQFLLKASVIVGQSTIKVDDIYIEKIVADVYVGGELLIEDFEIKVNSKILPDTTLTLELAIPVDGQIIGAAATSFISGEPIHLTLKDVRVWLKAFGQDYPEVTYPDVSLEISFETRVKVYIERIAFENPGDRGTAEVRISISNFDAPVRITELSGEIGGFIHFELDRSLESGEGWFRASIRFEILSLEEAGELVSTIVSGGNITLIIGNVSFRGLISTASIALTLDVAAIRLEADPALNPTISVKSYKLVPPGDHAEVVLELNAHLAYDLGAPIVVIGGSFKAMDRSLGLKIGDGEILSASSSITYDYQFTRLKVKLYLEESWVKAKASTFIDGGVVSAIAKDVVVQFKIYDTEYQAAFKDLTASISVSKVPVSIEDVVVKVNLLAGLATDAEATVRIHNPYNFDVTISSLKYNVYDNKGHVYIGSNTYSGPLTIPAGSTVSFKATLPISSSAASRVASYCDWSTNHFSMYIDVDGKVNAVVYSLDISGAKFERRRIHATGTCATISGLSSAKTYNSSGKALEDDAGAGQGWLLYQLPVRSRSLENMPSYMASRQSLHQSISGYGLRLPSAVITTSKSRHST